MPAVREFRQRRVRPAVTVRPKGELPAKPPSLCSCSFDCARLESRVTNAITCIDTRPNEALFFGRHLALKPSFLLVRR